ncbi:hypothetical protein Ancab_012605 [Ancistrocladus abbreviatus]
MDTRTDFSIKFKEYQEQMSVKILPIYRKQEEPKSGEIPRNAVNLKKPNFVQLNLNPLTLQTLQSSYQHKIQQFDPKSNLHQPWRKFCFISLKCKTINITIKE